MLNLFLAILLENFDSDSLQQQIKKEFKEKQKDNSNTIKLKSQCQLCRQKCEVKYKNGIKNCFRKKIQIQQAKRKSDFSALGGLGAELLKSKMNMVVKKQLIAQGLDQMQGKSLFIFSPEHRFRQLLFKLANSKKFEYFILSVILISSIVLAISNPLNNPNGTLQTSISYIDIATTTIFCLEAIVKIITYGFLFCGQSSYLKNLWNALDFLIVIFSILADTPLPNSLGAFKMLRIIRPLRVISQNEGLKTAVKALAQAIPSMINVTIVMLLFFLIFGMVSISYFKGRFFYCYSDGIDLDLIDLVTNKWDCLNTGGAWLLNQNNFDNILQATMTLFYSATSSGWSEVMFQAVAATQIDYVMVDGSNQGWEIFFICFMIVCNFFLVNLFVGVVISNFNRQKDQIGGNNLLTEKQKEWIDTKLLVLKSKPIKMQRPPENKFRRVMYLISDHLWFERSISIVIIMNTIVLLLTYYEQSNLFNSILEDINYVFTAIFTIEALIKIIGLGRIYFKEGWNIFDFFIVIGSILSILLSSQTSINLKGTTTIIRAFRILRILRLVKRAKSLRLVFSTLIVTLPAMANVGGFLCLLLYMYSILGTFLFATVQRNGPLNEVVNFESFPNAFITLFTAATADTFNPVYLATTRLYDIDFQCNSNPTYQDYIDNNCKINQTNIIDQTVGCGTGKAGLLYFFSFILLVKLIFLNLFIAIILEGYDDTQMKDERLFNAESLNHYRVIWSHYDPEASSFIQISQLKDFLFELGLPLGWDDSYKGNNQAQERFLLSMDLPTYNGFTSYQFLDVLEALSLRLMVKEQMKKREQEKVEISYESEMNMHHHDVHNSEEQREEELQFKKEIEKEINLLKFQESAQNISDYKQVIRGEVHVKQDQQAFHKDNLTNLHIVAAEVAVKHLKYITAKRKLMRTIKAMEEQAEKEFNDKNIINIKDPQARRSSGLFKIAQQVQLDKKKSLNYAQDVEDSEARQINKKKNSIQIQQERRASVGVNPFTKIKQIVNQQKTRRSVLAVGMLSDISEASKSSISEVSSSSSSSVNQSQRVSELAVPKGSNQSLDRMMNAQFPQLNKLYRNHQSSIGQLPSIDEHLTHRKLNIQFEEDFRVSTISDIEQQQNPNILHPQRIDTEELSAFAQSFRENTPKA